MFADGVGGSSSSRLKFQLAGGAQPLILLPVQVNGEGPFQFILDTGASISLLSPLLAQRLRVEPNSSREGQSAGGRVAVSLAQVDFISLGDCRVSPLEVGIVDLSQVARTVGANIDGDLGYNFLRHFRLTIDYGAAELRIDDPKRFDYFGDRSLTEVPIRLAAPAKPLILVDAFIDGRGPFQFAIDTGTSTSAISAEAAATLGLKGTPIGAGTTPGAQVQVTAASVRSLQVGGAKIDDVNVVIGSFLAMLSEAAGTRLDGIIGYNFLRNFKVTIDYPNQQMTLFPA
jgi:predicted aspartyl protease